MITAKAAADDLYDMWFPQAGTELLVFRKESSAAAALEQVVTAGLGMPGGERFEVPGIHGAVGVRTWTPDGSVPSGFQGYTWNVYAQHGSTIARTFVAGGPADPNSDEVLVETKPQWQRNKALVLAAAREWEGQLTQAFGRPEATAGLPATPTPEPSRRMASHGAGAGLD
jgi:hypothetical protein